MSDSAADVLAAVVTATEAAWAACERGEADIDAIHEVLCARRELLARLDASTTLDPRARELASSLRTLDHNLLAWCEERRRELARALAQSPRRTTGAPTAAHRLLSDFA